MAGEALSALHGSTRIVDAVQAALRGAILDGALRAGEPLSVPELARRLNVSRSPVREALGIDMVGHPVMSHSVTIYFRADCSRALRGRNLGVIYVNNPRVRGFFRLEKTGMGGFFVVFTVGDIKDPAARRAADDSGPGHREPRRARGLLRERRHLQSRAAGHGG